MNFEFKVMNLLEFWCFSVNFTIFTRSQESGDFVTNQAIFLKPQEYGNSANMVIFTKSQKPGDFLKNLAISWKKWIFTKSQESGDSVKNLVIFFLWNPKNLVISWKVWLFFYEIPRTRLFCLNKTGGFYENPSW